MRMEKLKIGSWTIINDAYNANPDSTRAALETFVRLKGASAGAFCLGEMREIGPSSKEAHAEVGGLAARLGLDVLVAVGEVAAEAVRAARQAGMEEMRTFEASDHEEAAQALERLVPRGAWILIKGSRGSAMERVVELLATKKEVG
jgi:UDP-N-acetylmuramoyl-tripeptide--D-alanyl-D-alanine ligase